MTGATASRLAVRYSDTMYHDLLSPAETLAVRAESRAFAEAEIAPRAYALSQADESVDLFPHELFQAIGRQGLFGLSFGVEDGGRGLDYPVCATVSAIEEMAYFSNPVAAVYDVHCILAGRALSKAGPELRERYLRPVIAGQKIASFATTEPLASTDLSPKTLRTHAELVDGVYCVNGRKRFITNSPVADFVVALCMSPDGPVMLVIDLDTPGVRVGAPDLKLGNRCQLTADIEFNDVRVAETQRIGSPGDGLRTALASLTYGRVGIAACGVGMAQAAFDQGMAHLLSREAFGRKLGAFQHWQFRMADRAMEIENARSLYLKAARRLDAGESAPEPEAAMAKAYATELSVSMARDAIQIMGGYGYMRKLAAEDREYPVEAIYRDAKIGEIYEGPNEIQRMIIARRLFGRDVVG